MYLGFQGTHHVLYWYSVPGYDKLNQIQLFEITDANLSISEYDLCQSWGLSEAYLSTLTFNAAKASFYNDADKKEILKVNQRYEP